MMWILIVAGALIALLLACWLIGTRISRTHSATVTATYRTAPDQLFPLLIAYQDFPSWRTGVTKATRREATGERLGWVETSRFGNMPLEVIEQSPPRLLRLRIADDTLPFGGTWTYRLEPAGAGTRLSITEDGEIKSAFFRFLARVCFGYHRTLQGYLQDLARKLGDEVVVVRS